MTLAWVLSVLSKSLQDPFGLFVAGGGLGAGFYLQVLLDLIWFGTALVVLLQVYECIVLPTSDFLCLIHCSERPLSASASLIETLQCLLAECGIIKSLYGIFGSQKYVT